MNLSKEIREAKFTTISQAKKLTGLSYLGSVNSSAKIEKNIKEEQLTYILYLAPAEMSGYNTCPLSTAECRQACLVNSGRVKMDTQGTINKARIKKTWLYYENRPFFYAWLKAEIESHKKRAEKKGLGFSVRLNGTSDIQFHKGIYFHFSDVQFYDYTKIPKKFINKPRNLHLTFSYTGYNWKDASDLLSQGFNVAVVFDTKKNEELPAFFNGFPVLNGDYSDYRPADKKGHIVGLRFKTIKGDNEKALKSKFVVNIKSL